MDKKICIFGLSIGVAIVLLFPVADASVWSSANAPVWTVGDWWQFYFRYKEEDKGTNEWLCANGTFWYNVTSTKTVNVNGTDYDVYESTTFQNGTFIGVMQGFSITGEFVFSGTEYIVQANYSTVQSFEKHRRTGQADSYRFWMEGWSLTNYTPPKDEFNFPINIGETWRTNCVLTITSFSKTTWDPAGSWHNSTELERNNYTCEGVATITVPAGTFDTYVINQTKWGDPANYTLLYYAEAAGNLVKIFTWSGFGSESETYTSVLVAYNYTSIPELTTLIPFVATVLLGTVFLYRSKKR